MTAGSSRSARLGGLSASLAAAARISLIIISISSRQHRENLLSLFDGISVAAARAAAAKRLATRNIARRRRARLGS